MDKYLFNGQDITFDILVKIEKVVELIAKNEKKSFDECYESFVKSKTYQSLQNIRSLMWAENAEFIVDEYYRE